MKWQGKGVLVTGAGGFIGSHLVETLVRRGAKVRAFVRYNSSQDIGRLRYLPPAVFRKVEVYSGDLRDEHAVWKASQGVQVIFHLGALIAIPYSYVHPREVVQTNVVGTLNVLQAAMRNGVERLVHTSTSEVYGTAQYVPIDERHPLMGQSPYAASKIGADKLVESFYLSFGVPVATLRPFNTYGERQSQRAVIPTIIAQALRGKVVQLGALHPTRDFTHVSDTVEAFLRVALAPEAVGRVLNAGSGKETTIQSLAETVAELLGKKIRIEVDRKRLRPKDSEVGRLLADAREARRVLQWKPRVDLRTGLQRVIDWISSHPEDYAARGYVI